MLAYTRVHIRAFLFLPGLICTSAVPREDVEICFCSSNAAPRKSNGGMRPSSGGMAPRPELARRAARLIRPPAAASSESKQNDKDGTSTPFLSVSHLTNAPAASDKSKDGDEKEGTYTRSHTLKHIRAFNLPST